MYNAECKIQFTLSIGFSGVGHEEEDTLEGWTGINEYALSAMTDEQAEDALEDAWRDWSSNYIDGGWRKAE